MAHGSATSVTKRASLRFYRKRGGAEKAMDGEFGLFGPILLKLIVEKPLRSGVALHLPRSRRFPGR